MRALLTRLLRRLLGIAADAAVDEVEELSAPTQRSAPLTHKDVDHIEEQIRRATKKYPVTCYSCGGLQFASERAFSDHFDQVHATSPRAITARHAIPPPPRKPR